MKLINNMYYYMTTKLDYYFKIKQFEFKFIIYTF